MIVSFADRVSEDLFNGAHTKVTRKRLPVELRRSASRKLDQLNRVDVLDALRAPPGNRLEALKGDRRGQHSIRINDQYRICFVWTEHGPENVEVTDYH